MFDVAERDIARTARAVQRIERCDAVRVVTKLIARFQQAGDVAGAELWERVLAALPVSAAVRSARDVDRIESRRAHMTTAV